MSYSFDPSPQASRAFRQVMNNDYIRPLDGAHLHTYASGYHLASNLKGGAKVYYNFSPDCDVSSIRLRAGDQSIDL